MCTHCCFTEPPRVGENCARKLRQTCGKADVRPNLFMVVSNDDDPPPNPFGVKLKKRGGGAGPAKRLSGIKDKEEPRTSFAGAAKGRLSRRLSAGVSALGNAFAGRKSRS